MCRRLRGISKAMRRLGSGPADPRRRLTAGYQAATVQGRMFTVRRLSPIPGNCEVTITLFLASAVGKVCSDPVPGMHQQRRVAKQPKHTISTSRQNAAITVGGIWRRHLNKLRLTILAVSLPAVWQVYQNWLSSAIEHRATAIWAHVFDRPMPEGYIIRLDLRFGLDENAEAARYERTRVTLWPVRCKGEGGDRLTRTFDRSNSHQNVILQVTCNYHRQVTVFCD